MEMTFDYRNFRFSLSCDRTRHIRHQEVWMSDGKKEVLLGEESMMVASASDTSLPANKSIGKDYNSECSCCWLNINHSIAYHQQKLAAKKR